jgi:TP901 family phage tail tape measure protein
VFVEIGADAKQFFSALNRVQKEIGKIGQSMASVGTRMMGVGAALGAPFIAASVAGARFQDVLLNVQASTGATASDLDQVRKAAMAMSQAMGVGPTEIAGGFLELLKAGMSLEDVLGGAGKAAIAFAKVGGLAVADAAVVMADAMNVFKVSGDVAANTLSAAADASSTSIQGIAMAFSQVSAVAGLANQSIQDTATALAVLANAGIKGSDAGTSLKTMLMRLMAPADDAVGALQQLGLNVQSFRNADGTMKPLVQIIGTLNDAMVGMDQAAKDDIFRRIFGQDAIRAAAVLTSAGVEGFQAMQDGMAGAATVGDKFGIMSSGLSGTAAALYAALERLAIVVSDAIGPSLIALGQAVLPVINGFAQFVSKNQELVAAVAKGIAIFTGTGAAILGIGLALQLVAGGMAVVLSPLGLIVAGVAGLTAAVATSGTTLQDLSAIASTTFTGIYDAIAAGDLAGAMDILWAGLQAGWMRGTEELMGHVDSWVALFQNTFTYAGTGIATTWEAMWSGLVQGANTIGAVVLGVVDNLVNGVMAAFDAMVAAVRKSWNWVQSFIVDGYDLAEENQKVDSEMAARARQREAARPGVSGRMDRAARENAATSSDTQSRIDAMNQAADETAAGRLAAGDSRAADRRAATKAAEDRVTSMTRAASDRRAFRSQADDVIGQFGTASSMGQIQELADEFHALAETGHLTEQQMQAFSDAVDAAQERAMTAGDAAGGAGVVGPVDPRAIADAAAAAAASQAEVAGTFSADAVGGMSFGQSMAQKQLDTLNKIENNTRNDDAGAVAA